MWRARWSEGGRKGEEIDPLIWSGEWRGRRIHHPAGMCCSDINFGPEPVGNEHILWQMGEPEELKHWRGHVHVPADCRDTTWRLENRGRRVSPEEWITDVLCKPFDSACWWQTHPRSITPSPRVLKYILSWLGSSQTESRFLSSLYDSHFFLPRPQRPSDGSILIPPIFVRTQVICLQSLMMEMSGICLSDKFWVRDSFWLLETSGIGSCKWKWSL